MARRKKSDYEKKMLKYVKQFHDANSAFYGVPGEIIETDMGPDLTWVVRPDKELGTYLMLTAVFDMLFDLYEKLEKEPEK